MFLNDQSLYLISELICASLFRASAYWSLKPPSGESLRVICLFLFYFLEKSISNRPLEFGGDDSSLMVGVEK
jgi:hypothetical protein